MAKFKCNICGQTFEADKMPDKCPICGADNSNIEEIVESSDSAATPKKNGIDTNSNVYTIVYAAVMVIIVAFLLAYVSSALKPTQDANVANDTKGQILKSLNMNTDGIDVAKTYSDVVKDNIWKDGKLVPVAEKDFKSSYGQAIKNGELHVFVANTKEGVKYIIPVTGRGLWGGLWGYVALNQDKQTVYGTYFYHESETAGLGARIGEREFQTKFNKKPIFLPGSDDIALTVVKNGTSKIDTEIDGITGATLTSKGVAAMIHDGLDIYKKAGFLTSNTVVSQPCQGTPCGTDTTTVKKCDNCGECQAKTSCCDANVNNKK